MNPYMFPYEEPVRILIVDDQIPQRRLECDILSEDGFITVEAESGQEALTALTQLTFDMVLVRINLPDINGLEVCDRIRNQLKLTRMPVLLVTENNTGVNLARAFELGATDFISKPFRPIELLIRVRSAIAQKQLADRLERAEAVLFTVGKMVEARVPLAGDHCARLSHCALVFGKALGMDEPNLTALGRGGVLHDIGMLAVPERILSKPGPLSDSERRLICRHTVIGEKLCRNLESTGRVGAIIRSHHERYDGSGYPDGLVGGEIPLLARIFQIIDIYDALAHPRPL